MSFATDKASALVVLNSYDCDIAGVADRLLVDYSTLFAVFIYLEKYFQCYPSLMTRYLVCWNDTQLIANKICFNKTDITVEDAYVVANSTYDHVTITVPTDEAIAQIVVIGSSQVGKLSIDKDTDGLYLGMINVVGGAKVDILELLSSIEVKILNVGGCNGIVSTVEVASGGSDIVQVMTSNGGFFGGFNCIDPASACASDISALAVNKLTANSLLLNWVAASESVRTIVQYRESNTLTWFNAGIDNEDGVSGNYASDGSLGYAFRGLKMDTYYDFKVTNVCLNGILSAGVQISQKTNGIASGGGGGVITTVIDKQIEFDATDGQTTYAWLGPDPNPLLYAAGVAVYIEGARKFVGSGADKVQFDDTTGTITFNTPLTGPPTLPDPQHVQIDVFR